MRKGLQLCGQITGPRQVEIPVTGFQSPPSARGPTRTNSFDRSFVRCMVLGSNQRKTYMSKRSRENYDRLSQNISKRVTPTLVFSKKARTTALKSPWLNELRDFL